MSDNVFLDVKSLRMDFDVTKTFARKKIGTRRAVNDIDLHIFKGETLGLVGESGCGKTTTGRCVMRAIEPSAGSVMYRFDGGEPFDLLQLRPQELKQARRNLRMIFQDPYSSLNPRMNVLRIISAPLVVNKIATNRGEIEDRVSKVLEQVGLDPQFMSRYPHAFSGGQRQRIAIARAIVLNPKFIVADEPVSALDVSIQAQILNLMKQLKEQLDLTYLFIAHNLAVVERVSDRVAVMYMGKIVELARTDDLFRTPKHPYAEALLSAVPVPDPDYEKQRVVLEGEVGDLMHPPTGCLFHPRCRYAKDICATDEPPTINLGGEGSDEHLVACHFAAELSLRGISRIKMGDE